jgi:hypothetical protein
LPSIFAELKRLRARDNALMLLAGVCGASGILLFLALGSSLPLLPVILIVGAVGLFVVRPRAEIERLQQAIRELRRPLGSDFNREAEEHEISALIAVLNQRIEAVERFRNDLAAQRPRLSVSARDMDLFLNDALKRLERRERARLNIYTDDEVPQFDPIVRWASETSRKSVLRTLRPLINSKARRDSHYARYEFQLILVHRGQLTVYEGFHDLIQGEMMGELRRHVVLANLFLVNDEIAQDFDFHRKVGEEIAPSGNAYDEQPNSGSEQMVALSPASSEDEEAANRVSITQTRTVRLVGNGEQVELNFVVSEERDTWIAELQRERQREEQEIANLQAMSQQSDDDEDSESAMQLNAHEERLLRIREYEERVRRSGTAQQVEEVVSRLLEFARQADRQRAGLESPV